MKCIKIGLIRETKFPPDRRVALPPVYAAALREKYPEVSIVVQPSDIRCYKDEEYVNAGIPLQEDLSDCDLLIGIKEVKIDALLPGKHYLFFAHVAKKQVYNRPLLKALLDKGVTLSDYEYFTDEKGIRLIAFGRWAGIIGSFNGLRAWAIKQGMPVLMAPHECLDRQEMDQQLDGLDLGKVRILLTGGGRVAHGAMETLDKLGIPLVSPAEYLEHPERTPVICRIDPADYVQENSGSGFDFDHFIRHPEQYHSVFNRFYSSTDFLISAHYWDPKSPRLFEPHEMARKDFRIRVIADISCDINGSIPSTVRATRIDDPFYDWDPQKWCEAPAFTSPEHVTMMTIDNLPGELPRDASDEFAGILIKNIMPYILGEDTEGVICRATITWKGELTENFNYLEEFAREAE
jgi:alanine dehydrogenase